MKAEVSPQRLNFLVFWALNNRLDLLRMKRQLRRFQSLGFDGVVLQPRFYPGDPPYLSEAYLARISALILAARALGLQVWLYDENGWPSGRADGQVLAALGSCQCEWLILRDGQVCVESKTAVNTLDPAAMDCFVRLTYERYATALQPEAFDWLTGFFSDEVGFLDGSGVGMSLGGVPWHPVIGQRYAARYGARLEDSWKALFTDQPGCEILRTRYWELVSDWLAENFYQRINTWCRAHGKRYMAHLKGEETPFFQMAPSGSAFRCLRQVETPGVDALGRQPGNAYYPRIAASLARQFGSGDSMAEVFGGSGWGLTPADFAREIAWLASCGITTFVIHQSQLSLSSAAIRDWPPSLPGGVNWQACFPDLLARLHTDWDSVSVRRAPVLLVVPTRRLMGLYHPGEAQALNEHNGTGMPHSPAGDLTRRFMALTEVLHERQIDFDVTEEWMVEQYAEPAPEGIRLGRAVYSTIIASRDCLWQNGSPPVPDSVLLPADALRWRLIGAGLNQLLLDKPENRISVPAEALEGVFVVSLDPLTKLCVMGEPLTAHRQDEGVRYDIPPHLLARAAQCGQLQIDGLPAEGQPWPPVYLRGQFLVSAPGTWSQQERQCRYCGSFALAVPDLTRVDPRRLVETGFPFLAEPVTLRALCLAGADGFLCLGHFRADAVFVTVDDTPQGFFWEQPVRLSGQIPGPHTVQVRLYPSTYNMYGPHHYYAGDASCISPAQFTGEKNYADAPDAPCRTQEDAWRFVCLGVDDTQISDACRSL